MTNIYICDVLKIKDFGEYELNISNNCLVRAKKYKLNDDYHCSLIGWYLVEKYLKKDFNINIDEYDIKENEYRKPYIDTDVFFNISHSKNIVSVIISDKDCGIDIECVRELKNKEALAGRLLLDCNLSDEEFIKNWTIREAYYKMVGSGIDFKKLKMPLNANDFTTIKLIDSLNNKYLLSYYKIDDIINIYNEN